MKMQDYIDWVLLNQAAHYHMWVMYAQVISGLLR